MTSRRSGWPRLTGPTPFRTACLLVGLAAALPSLGVLVYLGLVGVSQDYSHARQGALRVARVAATALEQTLTERRQALVRAAAAIPWGQGDASAADAELRLLVRAYPELRALIAVDGRGVILGATVAPLDARAVQDRWRAAARVAGSSTGEPIGLSDEAVVFLDSLAGAPAAGAPGALVAEYALGSVQTLIRLAVPDPEDVILVRSRQGALVLQDPAVGLGVEGRLARGGGAEESAAQVELADGRRYMAGTAPVPGVGWELTVARPLSEFGRTAWARLMLLAMGAVLSAVVGLLATRFLTRRPAAALAELRTAIRRLERGDIPADVPMAVGGEIGALTQGLNRVLRWLRKTLGDYQALSQLEEAVGAAAEADAPPEALLRDVLRHIVRAMAGDVGAAVVPERDGFALTIAVGLWGIPVEGTRLRRGEGLAGPCAFGREVVVVADTVGDPRGDATHIRAAGLRSMIAAPMIIGGDVAAVIEVGYRAPRELGAIEAQRLSALVARAARAVGHARTLESAPDLAARVAIIGRRASEAGQVLPEPAARYLAEEVTSSVRDLGRCVGRLLAFCELTGRPPSLEVAQEFVAKIWRPERGVAPPVTAGPERFLAVVRRGATDLFQTVRDFFGGSGTVEVVWDRRTGARRKGRAIVGRERRRTDRREVPSVAAEGPDYQLVRRRPDGDTPAPGVSGDGRPRRER